MRRSACARPSARDNRRGVLGAPHATGDESRAFAEIICDLGTTVPMLPIRFPTMLPTRSAVLSELQAKEAMWCQRLAELDGLSEVAIRAQEAEPITNSAPRVTARVLRTW
jgi:Gas vesicle synthesis protein GvpL/GvpF